MTPPEPSGDSPGSRRVSSPPLRLVPAACNGRKGNDASHFCKSDRAARGRACRTGPRSPLGGPSAGALAGRGLTAALFRREQLTQRQQSRWDPLRSPAASPSAHLHGHCCQRACPWRLPVHGSAQGDAVSGTSNAMGPFLQGDRHREPQAAQTRSQEGGSGGCGRQRREGAGKWWAHPCHHRWPPALSQQLPDMRGCSDQRQVCGSGLRNVTRGLLTRSLRRCRVSTLGSFDVHGPSGASRAGPLGAQGPRGVPIWGQ